MKKLYYLFIKYLKNKQSGPFFWIKSLYGDVIYLEQYEQWTEQFNMDTNGKDYEDKYKARQWQYNAFV